MPPWGTPGALGGEGPDSCKDSGSSYQYGVGSGRGDGSLGGGTILNFLRVFRIVLPSKGRESQSKSEKVWER